MIPPFGPEADGAGIYVLPRGIHPATLDEIAARFGCTPARQLLMVGLRAGLDALEQAGCRDAYVDGSFVTSKEPPNDFDVVWDPIGVDPFRLDPVFWRPEFVKPPRKEQKRRYRGEFLPNLPTPVGKEDMLSFFQRRRDGGYKGVVWVHLGATP